MPCPIDPSTHEALSTWGDSHASAVGIPPMAASRWVARGGPIARGRYMPPGGRRAGGEGRTDRQGRRRGEEAAGRDFGRVERLGCVRAGEIRGGRLVPDRDPGDSVRRDLHDTAGPRG